MHILIIPSWYINSYESLSGIFFKEQAEALAKRGNQVGIIALNEIHHSMIISKRKIDFRKEDFIENGVHTYNLQLPFLPKFHKTRRKIKEIIFKKIFSEYVSKNSLPDIVHLHSFMSGELAIWLKEKYGIPYIVTEHYSGFAKNTIPLYDWKFAEKVFMASSYNISVSDIFLQLLEKKFNLKFEFIPNIVDTSFFNMKNDVNTEEYNFINIAFLNKNKNQNMLIKSFVRAFKDNQSIKLTIVGNGEERENLKKIISHLKAEKQIILYGRADRNKVKELLHNSNAFILSSVHETFGVVLIEAMSCGLPVVSTKSGGPESIITNEKLGLLSDIDEISLSKKLLELYNKRDEYNPDYIRSYIVSNFSEKAVCSRLEAIYSSVIENKKDLG